MLRYFPSDLNNCRTFQTVAPTFSEDFFALSISELRIATDQSARFNTFTICRATLQ